MNLDVVDRRGQVWADNESNGLIFVVVGEPHVDDDSDVEHPILILYDPLEDSDDPLYPVWYEFYDARPWEDDPCMERLA